MDSLYCICPPPSVSAVTYTVESVMDFSTALMVGAESFTSELVMEAADVSLAPNCQLGPISLAACLHVDFVSYNAVFQEQSMGIHYNQGAELLDFVKNKADFNMEGGYFKPLMKPGLGVDIDEEKVIEMSRRAPDWRNPVWRLADGVVAEW